VKETVFSSGLFSNSNLSPHLVDCLIKRFKLEKMTLIQEKTIPAILSGKDCFVKSQTGSGKTLAYAIPIIQHLQSLNPKLKRTDGIKALVLVPTRELAIQTCQVFEQLCNACVWIVPGALIGGMKKKSEKDRIRRGLNILIATPGRLCDHLDTTIALDLSKLDYLIFDEADRMLDMDFEKKINFIIFKIHSAKKKALAEPEIPKFKLDENGEPIEDPNANLQSDSRSKRIDPQTILISATLTNGIKEIARRLNINDALHLDAKNDISNNSNENYIKNENNTTEDVDKIALPSGLTHNYMITPSKLRLIGLISFILDKFVVNIKID
jgi:ATP-dependent RNA helicase DDX31/DBP7